MRYRLRRKRSKEHDASFASVSQTQAVQTSLEVGRPEDVYEQEAEAVANKVVMMPNRSSDIHMEPAMRSPDIHMKCADCEKEEKVQMKSKEEEEKVN